MSALDTPATPLRAAKEPTGPGPVAVVGPVLAVLLGALGVVLLQDSLVAAQGKPSGSWLRTATRFLVGVGPASWMVPAGIVVALLGLWLVLTALRRRTRRSLALTAQTGAHLSTSDVARLATSAAGDVDGVLSASSSASRRRVAVTVTTTGGAGISGAVTTSVTGALSALVAPPRVAVRATSAAGSEGTA